MATLISEPLEWVADQIVHHCDYKSAVLSGLAPDPRHLERGGFHCSVLDLRAHGNQGDYSNTRRDDKDLNVKYGAAFDVSMSKADMIRAFGRVHTVWADRADPRRQFVNAINGWDGSGDATRLDFDAGTAKFASADHTWHVHGEIHRRFLLDMRAARAVVSIFRGEPKTTWMATEAPKPRVQEVTMLPVDGQLPQLKKGMKDPVNSWYMVTRLQLMLRIKPDGEYWTATAAAVAEYNAKNLGRTTDGSTVDAAFWRHLYGITGG